MEIKKNNKALRTDVCKICLSIIRSKYEVIEEDNTYHLSCYYEMISQRLNRYSKEKKELSKPKYKRQMILEKIEK